MLPLKATKSDWQHFTVTLHRQSIFAGSMQFRARIIDDNGWDTGNERE